MKLKISIFNERISISEEIIEKEKNSRGRLFLTLLAGILIPDGKWADRHIISLQLSAAKTGDIPGNEIKSADMELEWQGKIFCVIPLFAMNENKAKKYLESSSIGLFKKRSLNKIDGGDIFGSVSKKVDVLYRISDKGKTKLREYLKKKHKI